MTASPMPGHVPLWSSQSPAESRRDLRMVAAVILFWATAGAVCTALINPIVGACVTVGSGALVAFIAFAYVPRAMRVLRGIPEITLTMDGVTLPAVKLRIPWTALAEVRFTTLPHPDKGEVPVLLLVTIDPQQQIDSSRGLTRHMIKTNQNRFGGPYWISLSSLATTRTEIIAAVRTFSNVPVNG